MEIKSGNTCPTPRGVLLAIGGHENKGEKPEKEAQKDSPNRLEILKIFIGLTGKDNPSIEIITTASEAGKESFNEYQKAFSEIGVSRINHIHHQAREDVTLDTVEERIRSADAIFFSGGDQLKLTSVYGGTKMLEEMKKRYIETDIVIAGTSAGAMALSTPMIYAGNREVQQINGEIRITTGLEFLKDVCIDTHFIDRSRFVRMAQVITTNPTCIGIGIGEDTAMIIREGRKAEVAGSGIVIIIDGFHISESNILQFSNKVPLSVKNLKVHLLVRGDTYEIPQNNPPHI